MKKKEGLLMPSGFTPSQNDLKRVFFLYVETIEEAIDVLGRVARGESSTEFPPLQTVAFIGAVCVDEMIAQSSKANALSLAAVICEVASGATHARKTMQAHASSDKVLHRTGNHHECSKSSLITTKKIIQINPGN